MQINQLFSDAYKQDWIIISRIVNVEKLWAEWKLMIHNIHLISS